MKNVLFAFFAFVFCGILCVSCGDKHDIVKDDVAAKGEEVKKFVLTDTMMKRIRVDSVRSSRVHNALVVPGKVTPDENQMVKIFALGDNAIVEKVFVELGDFVSKGQKLAVVRSTDMSDLERQRIDAQNQLTVVEKNLKVTQDLYDGKLAPERDLIAAKGEVQKAQSEITRVKDILHLYNANSSGEYTVTATSAGYIIDKNVASGTQIRGGGTDAMFAISQIKEVWVMANINEVDIAKVKMGMEAEVATLSYPDKVFKGKVDKIYNILDEKTKTMRARIRFANADLLLKPEMNAVITLKFDEGTQALPYVPAESVIFDKSKHYVMVFHSRDNIETRPVTISKSLGSTTWISEGLKVGEKILTRDQLLVYDALND
jgi:membrane fusion protein, heavy metal efflux system